MIRTLTDGEAALARGVFGGAVDCRRVRIVNMSVGSWAVVIGPLVFMPPHAPADFSAVPPGLQAWLVHELTHVWQFQTAPLRTLRSWARTLLSGGYGPGLPGYRYPLPLPDWSALNLEQQASVVEHAFLLRRTGRCPAAGATLQELEACAPFKYPPPTHLRSGGIS